MHVVDADFLSDQVRLLQACLVVVADEPINNSELRLAEPQLRAQEDGFIRPEVDTLRLLEDQHFDT